MPLITAEPQLLRTRAPAPFAYTFAFQPIVDAAERRVWSYEALLRGPRDETAAHVLKQARGQDLHRFDREARLAAIALAGRLCIPGPLNLNCLPLSLREPDAAIAALRAACDGAGLSPTRLILEVTEEDVIERRRHFAEVIDLYRGAGMRIAIDHFGAGYSGLNLLADYQPDFLKIDRALVRGIFEDGLRQAIVRAVGQACRDLGIAVIAQGVETIDEWLWFCNEGVRLFQGELFAKPGFETLPEAAFP